MKNMDYVLDVKNLSTSFISDRKEVRIVKNVSLRLRRGTTLAVVGESGCGKSVTVHSIVKLMPKNAKVTADQVLYRSAKDGKEYRLDQMEPFGVEMRKLRGAEIGMVFQDPMSSLNPVYKVGDQVAEGLIQHTGMSKAEARQRVLDMFRKLGIPDPESRISDYPHQFSGGMKQRVVIAIAMICNPDIIIADEPISALDVSIQAQVVNMFEDLQREMGLTYLFIAHDLSVVKHISNRIGVMYLGKLVELADSFELIAHSVHPYTRSLISAIPVADPRVARASKRIPLQGDVPSPLNPPSGCRFRTRCPYATERCAAEVPEFREVAAGHWAACHNLDQVEGEMTPLLPVTMG